MNFKSAITEASKEIDEENKKIQTRLERVIKYSTWPEKPGWVKISYAWEEVPIRSTVAANNSPSGISLENYVRLQERRNKEYDASRWPGAFRERYPMNQNVSEFEHNDSRRALRQQNLRVGGRKLGTRTGEGGEDSGFEDDLEDTDAEW
jgi:hypothetical protein